MYLAWQSHFGVRLQTRRLRECTQPESGDGQLLVDSTALVIALWRLRLAAEMSVKLAVGSADLKAALSAFDQSLPGLKRLRHVTMHFDNYALENDSRRNEIGDPKRLIEARDLWDIEHTSDRFTWLEVTITYGAAEAAAQKLYDAVQDSNNSQLARES